MDLLIAQERALHSPASRNNATKLTQLLHPQFQEVGASGSSYDFQSIVSMMNSEEFSEWQVHSQDFQSVILAENVCLLLYKTCLLKREEATDFAKRSSVWVKNGDSWQIQYHQGTRCNAFAISPTE